MLRSILREPLVRGFTCVALAFLAGACGILDPRVCHTGVFIEVDPITATLAVGQSVTPTATIETCPEGVRRLELSWSAQDPGVVRVAPESGQITGLREGESEVRGADVEGAVVVTVSVTVRDPS
ncbi:MAG: hypothetical protein EA350_05120 [Gemmatimonadales bacterium]|nr:MAG: hypothetical protein EA350_05120 [Gemmatimonadales bacterium]